MTAANVASRVSLTVAISDYFRSNEGRKRNFDLKSEQRDTSDNIKLMKACLAQILELCRESQVHRMQRREFDENFTIHDERLLMHTFPNETHNGHGQR